MTGKLSKILSFVLGGLLLITVIVFALFYLGGTEDGNPEVPQYTSLALQLAYIFLGITIFLAIIFPIYTLIQRPKSAISALVGIIGLAIIILISYFMASGELLDMPKSYHGPDNNPTTLKLTDAGIYTMYILLALAIFGIIATEVMKVFKRS
ncbi:MAG: hypothetical protein Kow0068_02820 [Marinilabiliales bacterium]